AGYQIQTGNARATPSLGASGSRRPFSVQSWNTRPTGYDPVGAGSATVSGCSHVRTARPDAQAPKVSAAQPTTIHEILRISRFMFAACGKRRRDGRVLDWRPSCHATSFV